MNGLVTDVSKLTNELDRIFIAQITSELNSYIDAMEKTKFDFELFFIFVYSNFHFSDFVMGWNPSCVCLNMETNITNQKFHGKNTKVQKSNGKFSSYFFLHSIKFFEFIRIDAETTISLTLNLVYLLSLVLQPFMPTTSNEIRQQLNAQHLNYALENHFRCYLPSGHQIGHAHPLIEKIEQSLIDEYRSRFSGQ